MQKVDWKRRGAGKWFNAGSPSRFPNTDACRLAQVVASLADKPYCGRNSQERKVLPIDRNGLARTAALKAYEQGT
jgi:hypothetical protein